MKDLRKVWKNWKAKNESLAEGVMAIKIGGVAGDEIPQKIIELEKLIEASVSFQQCACRNKYQRKVALRLV